MIEYVSATSIKLFSDCERKWYHTYVLGDRDEGTAAMELGSEVHKILESFMDVGHADDFDKTSAAYQIAETGLPLLPWAAFHKESPAQGIEASLDRFPLEHPVWLFEGPDPKYTVPFRGFIDLFGHGVGYGDPFEYETGLKVGQPFVLDYKTTADLKYALTEEQLRTNFQLLIYAKHLLDSEYRDAESIMLIHVYFTTRKPYKAKRVVTELTRQEVTQAFGKPKDLALSMLDLSRSPKEATTPNPSFCHAFNRTCKHYDDCFFTASRREKFPMTEKKEKILGFLRGENNSVVSQLAAELAPAIVAEQAAAPATTPTPAQAEVHLYVGVNMVRGASPSPLSLALAKLIDQVQKEYGVEHVAFAPYGQGWTRLSVLLAQEGLPAGHWFVDPMSQYYTKLYDELMLVCTHIYTRG